MAIVPEIQQLLKELEKECERLTMTGMQYYDVKGSSPLTDVVFIATATHILQMDAARRSLSFMAKQAGYPVQNPTEDYSEGWLVLDCVDLVIHILIEEKRAFYDLDSLMESVMLSRSEAELEMLNEENSEILEEEMSDAELQDILKNLTPEEADEFLNNLKVEDDEE